jgi:hypothetical protein
MSTEKAVFRMPRQEAGNLHLEMLQLRTTMQMLVKEINECSPGQIGREMNGMATDLENCQLLAGMMLPLVVSALRRYEEIEERCELV